MQKGETGEVERRGSGKGLLKRCMGEKLESRFRVWQYIDTLIPNQRVLLRLSTTAAPRRIIPSGVP